jgi:hypothetical protein
MGRYIYQRSGGPLLTWRNGPPRQTRAADCVALGSLGGDTSLGMPLPRPGAPEPLGEGDCGCKGGGKSFIVDITSPSFLVGALLAYIVFGRRG